MRRLLPLALSAGLSLGAAPAATAQILTPVPAADLHSVLPGAGQMRPVTQLMWDEATQKLVRIRFDLHDVLDVPDTSMVWQPTTFSAATKGATGAGRIIWLRKGAALYDRGAVIATLSGTFAQGRISGQARFWHRSGTTYVGEWAAGRLSGAGRLQWANGDEYVGSFLAGLPEGQGTLIRRNGTRYRGTFQAGQQDGDGILYPADARAFRATWRRGEIQGARRPVPGRNGTAHILEIQQPAYADAALGISVDQTVPARNAHWMDTADFYDGYSANDALYVYPGRGFRDKWHGAAAEGLRHEGEFGWNSESFPPASFNLDFENKGTRPLFIVGGALRVSLSQTDTDPAIAVGNLGSYWCFDDTATQINFVNYGWSNPIAPSINAGILSTDGQRILLPLSGPISATWPRSKNELRGILQSAGVNLSRLGAGGFECPSKDETACLAAAKATGLFGPIADGVFVKRELMFATLAGTLNYQWRDLAGQTHAKSQRFSVDLKVGQFAREAECGEGGDFGTIYPNPVTLPTDRQNYEVPLPVNQAVAAGSLSRWTFQIESDKAARHIFQVVFQLSDGREITSRTVDLNYFRPAQTYGYTR